MMFPASPGNHIVSRKKLNFTSVEFHPLRKKAEVCLSRPDCAHAHPGQIVLTVQVLCIETDRSQQTVQTKIRLLLKKQSDQGLRCLPFHQHLLDALMQCYIKLFYF